MSVDKPNGHILTEVNDKIATVSFSHPASNSFPSPLLDALRQIINALSADNSVAVIVLKSEGEKAFCAGASFEELLTIEDLEQGKAFFSGFAKVINAMRKCKKLIIGRVQGKAVGGGVGLASACDYVFATEDAAIKLSEIAIGIGPFVIEPAVSRKIGKTAFSQLTLTPTVWKDAQWAKEKGLFAELFPSIESLDEAVFKLASQLALYNLEALDAIKKVFWENTNHWDTLLEERATISGQLVLSAFTKEALAKFSKA